MERGHFGARKASLYTSPTSPTTNGSYTSRRMNKMPAPEIVMLDGPAGRIEALYESPKNVALAGCAVVCHPHPVHGGTMLNKVVHTLARAFVTKQMTSLRFNFRGVGLSEGDFDQGEGELADALAAIAWIRNRCPGVPLWLAGFSFGGAIAMHAALQSSPSGLVTIAPAVYRFANKMTAQPDCPWLIVQGDKDELVDIDETIEYLNGLQPGPRLAVFPDGEHFFHGRLVELRNTIEKFIAENV